jgi:hypothetical protein
VAITQEFGKQVSKFAGTEADKQRDALRAKADAETDPDKKAALQTESVKWEEGGAYRVAMHTVIGGLTGGAAGAVGAGAASAAAPVLDQLQGQLQQGLQNAGLSKDTSTLVASLASEYGLELGEAAREALQSLHVSADGVSVAAAGTSVSEAAAQRQLVLTAALPLPGAGGGAGLSRRRRRAMALKSPSSDCISPRLGRVMDHSRGRSRAGASSTSCNSLAWARSVASRQARRLRHVAARPCGWRGTRWRA